VFLFLKISPNITRVSYKTFNLVMMKAKGKQMTPPIVKGKSSLAKA
jgi:hypothetical protein